LSLLFQQPARGGGASDTNDVLLTFVTEHLPAGEVRVLACWKYDDEG